MTTKNKPRVVIVGAGPVGLLIALRLGQAGITTVVLESQDKPNPAVRAVAYMPVVFPALQKLGILEDMKKEAHSCTRGPVWRDAHGAILGELPVTTADSRDYILMIGQGRLAEIALDHLQQYPCVEVRFSHRCVGIDNGSDEIKVLARHAHEDVLLSAEYVVGTDGSGSFIRSACCIPFQGYTWSDFRLIGIDVWYDFEQDSGLSDFNMIVDEEDWGVILKTEKLGLWRVAYGEEPHLSATHEDITRRSVKRLAKYMKTPKEYRIQRLAPYSVHQRCAAQYRKGRVMLAGDAAHSNNPIGGLGLTGGILDAYAYGNALVRHLVNGESDELLTKCANSRREAWLGLADPTSTANLLRLRSTKDEQVQTRKAFFEALNTDADFPRAVWSQMQKMLPETFE